MSIRRFKRMVNKPSRTHFAFDLKDLEDAQQMIARKDWRGAQTRLLELNRKAPDLDLILAPLALTHYHLGELSDYLWICIQLGKLTPDAPEHQLALAHAYLMNERPALAYARFQDFLRRWPDHEEADKAREPLAELTIVLQKILGEMNLADADALELAAMHEESQLLMAPGRYKEALAAAENLLRRKPDFLPALNNMSQMRFELGELSSAIALAERVLASAPMNFQALGNLVHFLTAVGREADARIYADRLKASERNDYDRWAKQAEACASVGDDAGVLDALAGLEQRAEIEHHSLSPYAYHLAAVASLRLGRENEARTLWKKCLAISPDFPYAQENLADLAAPPPRRNGPWSFPLRHWLPGPLVNDFKEEHRRAKQRGEQTMQPATKRYFSRHPHLPALLPILFDRGDPAGREFAATLAGFARRPEMTALLREFGLGEKGSDEARLRALLRVLELSGGDVTVLPVWPATPHEPTRLRLVEIELEAIPGLPPDAQALYEEAAGLLGDLDGRRAEPLLLQALALAPDSPALMNNLAQAYQLQNRTKEAQALIHEIHERFPDYLFGRVNAACQLIHRRKFQEACTLMQPLNEPTRLHASEALALHNAWLLFLFTDGDLTLAPLWLDAFERIAPDSPQLAHWRERLEGIERERQLAQLRERLRK